MNDRINDLLDLINQYIKLNGNQEITGDIANLVMSEMVIVLNDIIGNPDDLNTIDKTNLVGAINETLSLFDSIQSPSDGNVVLTQDYLELSVFIGQMQRDFNSAVDSRFSSLQVFTKIVETALGINILGRLTANSMVGRSTVDGNVSGLFTIDLNDLSEQYILTLIGNSNVSFSNMIEDTQSVVISLSVKGNFALTLPSWLRAMPSNDDYDGTIDNEIVINIKQGGVTPLGYYSLTNIG